MHVGILPAYMSVHHMHAMSPEARREHQISWYGDCESPRGISAWSSGRAASTFNLCVITSYSKKEIS